MSSWERKRRRFKYRTLVFLSVFPSLWSSVDISIVPWWYALLLTSLYAEPETCYFKIFITLGIPQEERKTYLKPLNADIIPFVNFSIDVYINKSLLDYFRCLLTVERGPRQVDRIVRVSAVLKQQKVIKLELMNECVPTWYTVPPPLRRRRKGMPKDRSAGKLSSFHGFWKKRSS